MNHLLRAAIIGMGGISPMHTNALKAINIPITAVCDKDPARAEEVANKTGAQAFTDYREMLAAGGFEVLHICLPHFLHAPAAIDAMNAGYHVLCEKPMATTLADAEAMVAASKKTGRTLSIIFQNRYNAAAVLIKNAMNAGELGTIQGGWLRVTWFRDMEYYNAVDWRGRYATEGGGVLINQSIHTFDLMNYFLGAPLRVSGSISNRAHPEIEVEDVAEGIIFYADHNGGEAVVSFFVNTYHPYNAPVSLEIIGTAGRASMVGEDAAITLNDGTTRTAAADTVAQARFGMKNYWGVSHVKQITAFYESIKKGEPPEITAESALITQRLVNEIYAQNNR